MFGASAAGKLARMALETKTRPQQNGQGEKAGEGEMKYYYVEGNGWFVVRTKNKRRAKSIGVSEFGRGRVRTVREATKSEREDYVYHKGEDALDE